MSNSRLGMTASGRNRRRIPILACLQRSKHVKFWALFLIAAASLRADFSYQETVQVTGGDSVTVTHLLKGNRRADLTKGHVTVFDLDRGTVTEIDLSKKTYSVISFDDLKKSVKVA